MILQRTAMVVLAAAGLVVGPIVPMSAQKPKPDKEKPELKLRASPTIGFAPARVVATAELVGGPDDYEDDYCATVEWDWADNTTSSASYDCDPYQPGKSHIRRRFSQEHTYRTPGEYRITIRLKQGSRVVAFATAIVQVREDASGRATRFEPAAPGPPGSGRRAPPAGPTPARR
jgi:plastocyanin